ncbi:hypothetical protein N1037_14740 [Phaeobacter sp. G2]|nr:hypothetical protein N1037_14740 [Phaeobacter sp. G2]
MAWVKTGTVSVENGSAVVAGTCTNWFGSLQTGWGFVGPDGRTYEVFSVESATQITLASPYMGATAAGQTYAAFPTQSLAHDLTARLQDLISNYQGIYDKAGQGRFPGDVVFDADRDTGMTNPAGNAIGLKAGDVLQLMLAGGVASGAAVQSSPDDFTVGKLLKLGAGGLGSVGLSATNGDCNDITASGFHTFDSQTLNSPPFTPNGTILHASRTADIHTQLAISRAASSLGRFALRAVDPATGWSEWREGYTQGSILGTVSQSGGVPTGALIERGSNANGEYVRLADGTQICTCQAFNTSAAGDLIWTYPATFFYPASPGRPAVSGAVSALSSAPAFLSIGGIAGSGTVATDVAVRAVNLNGDRVALAASLIAIGRWF